METTESNKVKKLMVVEKEIHLLMAYKDNDSVLDIFIPSYSISMLVRIAAILIDRKYYRFSKKNHLSKYSTTDIDFMINRVLIERTAKINSYFVWTNENKKRFDLVFLQLSEAFMIARQEAIETAKALEPRIKQNDPFLKDYEIDIVLNPYPYIRGDREAAETVSEYLAVDVLRNVWDIGHSGNNNHLMNLKDEEIDEIWNTPFCYYDPAVLKRLSDDTKRSKTSLGYAGIMDRLLSSHIWSDLDILSIRKIWADVEVKQQHFRSI